MFLILGDCIDFVCHLPDLFFICRIKTPILVFLLLSSPLLLMAAFLSRMDWATLQDEEDEKEKQLHLQENSSLSEGTAQYCGRRSSNMHH